MKIFKYVVYLFALIGVLGSLYVGLIGYQMYLITQPDNEIDFDSNSNFSLDDYFTKYIYLDYQVSNPSKELPVPDAGAARLYGEVFHNQEPIEGLELDVILNAKFKVKNLVTDSQGRFYLDLPAGDWAINVIVINGWSNRPEGDFIVVTGFDPLLSDGSYSKYNNRVSPKVSVKEGDVLSAVRVTLTESLQIEKPISEYNYESSDDAEISWAAVKGAETYLVKILEVERRENGTTSFEIIERRVQGSHLVFSDLEVLASNDEEPQVYGIEILAFDEKGTLISESSDIARREFFTSGFRFVSDKAKFGLGPFASTQSIKNYYANEKRIQAAEILIEELMFESAEKIIEKLSEQAPKGKKDALTGYLYAKQGLCSKAASYFAKAISSGGKQCLPTSYRAKCEK